ncbi:ABC-2 type transport system ATP-binding protein [Anaerobranca californiensis DSM 14826]|uniref:ABC-2 type transport system ATP-binding protein n=1 Tax=Anaerobranca californiensis DSM 14826 TaxID=1120989 RepID=A0A1M6LAM7_9FIRM|nr:ABC transporter ATP-binding protein [Anaerobranca californiensis]SHJ68256.1 ABC-2 type transport system ATP-binding protein [Anaerobranca californiensis DSM 14826]
MFKVENLVKQYGNFTAVNDISFNIEKGSIFGLIGPNGAGKTTTMRIMATLLTKTSGKIELGGQDLYKNIKESRKLLGYMPDFFGVYDDLRVSEYLEFYGEAYGLNLIDVRKVIPDLLELVGLAHKREDFVNNLSRGMKQRLCLARTLIHQPEVLILDEPASGLDPRARVELRNIIKELQKMGKTILISSHILLELSQLCTHVGIIVDGKMPILGSMEQVLSQVQGNVLIQIKVLEDVEGARVWLLEQQKVVDVTLNNLGAFEVIYSGDEREMAKLLKDLSEKFLVLSFNPQRQNLEEVFMELTEVNGSEA